MWQNQQYLINWGTLTASYWHKIEDHLAIIYCDRRCGRVFWARSFKLTVDDSTRFWVFASDSKFSSLSSEGLYYMGSIALTGCDSSSCELFESLSDYAYMWWPSCKSETGLSSEPPRLLHKRGPRLILDPSEYLLILFSWISILKRLIFCGALQVYSQPSTWSRYDAGTFDQIRMAACYWSMLKFRR